ncbi:FtsX-like permease family protein [Catenuloplanes atrovinosus]|uniref:ABC3 transporter permease C-terminal domain-containing protein n=1 Tax=Catenuloplanes atrovinosus TaxID=137266 RepID=A0AAE3YYY6_9ACTN|nr:FtsX-like permease family protein [Catenuloplanes atrovinosus]MDR7281131.1 hypothetical protein [Catenuloplanes atrovinosus]
MIALVRAALRARWRSALVMMLLAAAAAGAAAAPLLYEPAARRAATVTEVAAAPAAERRLTAERHLSPVVPDRTQPERAFPPELIGDLPTVAGFDSIGGLWTNGLIVDPAALPPDPGETLTGLNGTLAWRSEVCAHLTVTAGRCATGYNEIVASARTADRAALAVGDTVVFHTSDRYPLNRYTVVGLYTPADPAAGYWAGRPFFAGWQARDPVADPFFTTRETVHRTLSADYVEAADLVARPEAFPGPARTATDVVGRWAAGTEWSVRTDLHALDARITAGDAQLRDGLALAGLPLVLLAWLVLWFAVSFGVALRRTEAGLFALRGTPSSLRWALVLAEAVLPVLAGTPLGYLAAWLLVSVVSATTLDGAPTVTPAAGSMWYAVAAVAGALLVGLAAQWRAVVAPVAVLLRATPARHRQVAVSTLDVVAGALAAAAAYQVSAVDEPAGGLELLVPMLIALTAGLLGARLAGLLAGRAAGRALRRGRLVRGLAAAEFARQPAQLRVVAISVIVFALVGFSATASVVAAEGRGDRARIDLGAPRVLTVADAGEQDLLRAVRAADPEGRYAMATARITRAELDALAVDSTRLATVADWDPRFGPDAATVASLIRPRPATPLRITGESVTVRATAVSPPPDTRLWITLLPATGPIVRVRAGDLRDGTHEYRAAVPACATGCRLGVLEVETPFAVEYAVDVTVSAITDATGPVDAGLTDPARWRVTSGSVLDSPDLAVDARGARLSHTGRGRPDLRLIPVVTPVPLPVVTGGEPDDVLPSATGPVPIARAGHLAAGPAGAITLVDLEYADLAAYDAAMAAEPQVWLRADTPDSVVTALTTHGLVITGERTVAERTTVLAGQGAALALRFHLLTAAGAVLLGVGALLVLGADRPRRVRQLRALRAQGLGAGPAWRSQLVAQLAVVGAGVVLGLAAGALAWWMTRGAITYYVDDWAGPAPPDWPRAEALLGPVTALVVLSLVAAGSALSLRRAVEER